MEPIVNLLFQLDKNMGLATASLTHRRELLRKLV